MARRMVSETAQKVLKSMEMSNDTNMTIGTNLNVDGQITQNGGTPIALYIYNINDSYNNFSFKLLSPIYLGANKVNLDDGNLIPQNILKNLYNVFKNYYLTTYEQEYTMNNYLSAVKDDGGEDDFIANLKIGYNEGNSRISLLIDGNNNNLVNNTIELNDGVYSVTLDEAYVYITCNRLL